MELECKLIEKHKVVQVGHNNKDKLGYVVKTKGNYPNDVYIETLNAQHIQFMQDTDIGAELIVHFDLRSRSWTSPKGEVKWFSSITAWKAEKNGNADGFASAPLSNNTPIEQPSDDSDTGLPF